MSDDSVDPRLADLVNPIIRERDDEAIIEPGWVATKVLDQLDPHKTVKKRFPEIYVAAHLAFRQTARAILRRKYPKGGGDGQKEDKSPPLPGFELLQRRYPRAHSDHEERGYILREFMSEADWRWNLMQFAKDIDGRQAHLDQFRRWGFARGFSEADAAVTSTELLSPPP